MFAFYFSVLCRCLNIVANCLVQNIFYKLIVTDLSKKSPWFVDPEYSLLCSQKHAIESYASNFGPVSTFISCFTNIHVIIILPSLNCLIPIGFRLEFCMHLSSIPSPAQPILPILDTLIIGYDIRYKYYELNRLNKYLNSRVLFVYFL